MSVRKWQQAKLSQVLNLAMPLIQAPMAGGITTPELVAAVANAGGLGSLGAALLPPNEIRKNIIATKQLTDKPFAVNLFIPSAHTATSSQMARAKEAIQSCCPYPLTFNTEAPYAANFNDQVAVLIEQNIRIFSFTFGIPDDEIIRACKTAGMMLIGTATHVAEVEALTRANIDIIVVQGEEAGGHRGTFLGDAQHALQPTLQLLSDARKVTHLPIVAAGGLMSADAITKAMNAESAGVQLGTIFLSCHESGHKPFIKKMLAEKDRETVLTKVYTGRFARGLNNAFIQCMQNHSDTILDYPIQQALTKEMRKVASEHNDLNLTSIWAGSAPHRCSILSAEEILKKLQRAILN